MKLWEVGDSNKLKVIDQFKREICTAKYNAIWQESFSNSIMDKMKTKEFDTKTKGWFGSLLWLGQKVVSFQFDFFFKFKYCGEAWTMSWSSIWFSIQGLFKINEPINEWMNK